MGPVLVSQIDESAIVIETSAVYTGLNYRGSLTEYVEGHIPGAVFVDPIIELSDAASPWFTMRPPAGQFRRVLSHLGLTPNLKIVIYDRTVNEWSSRLAWMLLAWGFSDVHVLDGGLQRWVSEGGALETGINRPQPSGEAPAGEFEPGRFLDLEDMLRITADDQADERVICLLSTSVFNGTDATYLERRGHIPGSLSLPFEPLLSPGNLIVPPPAGQPPLPVDRRRRLVLYCGSGVLSCLGAVVLTDLGYTNIGVYDGSLEEWAGHPELPLTVDS